MIDAYWDGLDVRWYVSLIKFNRVSYLKMAFSHIDPIVSWDVRVKIINLALVPITVSRNVCKITYNSSNSLPDAIGRVLYV